MQFDAKLNYRETSISIKDIYSKTIHLQFNIQFRNGLLTELYLPKYTIPTKEN